MKKEEVAWEGPREEILIATIVPGTGGRRMEIYLHDGIDHAELAVSADDFKRWASTALAELALAERREEEKE